MKKFDYTEQTFSYEDDEGNGVEWKVVDIIAHTNRIKPVFIDVSLFEGFLNYTIKQYNAEDWMRVKNADTRYPILVGKGTFTFSDDPTGGRYPYIFDGVHRLVKLLQDGVKKVQAVITETLPPPKVTGKGMQLNGIKYDMTQSNEWSSLSPEMTVLIRKSTHDPYLGGIALQKDPKDIVPILHRGSVVGFAIPRLERDGRWRTGPIFIDPVFRGLGYGGRWINEFFVNKKGRAWINPTNLPSIKSFIRAGFRQTTKSVKDGDGVLIEYLKD